MKFKIWIALIGLVFFGCYWLFFYEGPYVHEALGGTGKSKALVLYSPGLRKKFIGDVSLALADGLKRSGFSVDRDTICAETPGTPIGYRAIFVVSRYDYFQYDRPLRNYLKRAKLQGVYTMAILVGWGVTGADHQLKEDIELAGAKVSRTEFVLDASDIVFSDGDEKGIGSDKSERIENARLLGFNVGTAVISGRTK